ncbi:histidine kinase dimerization/phospho-acceptor domain-containing protein [Gallicola sp. Sow4_E12]|uniref:histidine kinase dimerization/phospho-acceptor domain-containing protein n=1 Tax=Gallicola sp. Sow4_E12 TaxID=3438785 RepID=UPI003F92AEBA
MNSRQNRLAGELMLLIVVGICIGTLLFFGLRQVSYTILDKELFNWSSIINQENKTVRSLQNYINENDLALADVDQLEVQMLAEPDANLDKTDPAYPVYFKDGIAQMISFTTYESYYRAADTVSAGISFLAFLGIVLYSIRRKLKYITKIESELKILGGGDLTYPITIKGKDELASLAKEVERMRCALLERQETEEAAHEANRGLVTAMSHDLRTPLTALIGYLELLKLDSDYTEQQGSICNLPVKKQNI